MKENTTLQFIINNSIDSDSVKSFKEESNYDDLKLLKKTFKALNYLIYDLSIENNEETVISIKKTIQLISFLCNYIEFVDEDIITNAERIRKARESLLAYSHKYNDFFIQECVNDLDKIILDKNFNNDELLIIIKELLNRMEEPNIIKKYINLNKALLSEELFEYTFNLTLKSLEFGSNDIYYYITMLKLFYTSKIDKKKYFTLLSNIIETKNNTNFIRELEELINGNRTSLTQKEILDKYHFSTNLPNKSIIYTSRQAIDDKIITIDGENTLLRDDAFSIKKDGNKYIIGIHIADAGKNIIPGSDLDITAKNNFKNMLMCKGLRLFPNDVEYMLSLNQKETRNVISLYVVMNDSGDILDYYIKKNDIYILKNLTYSECDLITTNHSFKELESIINTLYMISKAIEKKDPNKKNYWDKKNNSNSNKSKEEKEKEQSKGEIITSELMVLYNTLIGYITTDNNIPYIYKYQDEEYITKLIQELGLEQFEVIDKITHSVYLNSKYSTTPKWHSGLSKPCYTTSSNPLRKYPDLFSQYLFHKYYFKDKDFDINEEQIQKMVEYFNQRNFEINLMRCEYCKGLELSKKN